MPDLVCTGPGPHDPPSGVLGTSSIQPRGDIRCGAAVCQKPPDPESVNHDTILADLRQALAAHRTIQTQATVLSTATFANNTARDNAIRDLASATNLQSRDLVRLARMVLDLFDGVS